MKFAKLSLAAIVVAGLASSSFAASTTLEDAFKNGKVNGELRAWYFDRDKGVAGTSNAAADVNKYGHESIFNTGVILGYTTDSLYGLSLGLTFQSNYAPFADNASKEMYASDSFGSGAVLSEAYIQYKIGNTVAKLGRQFISTPLVAGSGARMIKEAFEGATVVNTDVPGTTLIAGYVDKFQGRTNDIDKTLSGTDSSNAGFNKTAVIYGVGPSNAAKTDAGKTNVLAFDGAYTVGAINKSVKDLALTAQYALVNDVANTNADAHVYYGEANYALPLSALTLTFDANYRGSKTGEALDSKNLEGNMYSGRVGFKELAGFGASFAYSTVSKSDSVILGLGNGPTTYTAPLIAAGEATSGANTDAYQLQATYDFSKVGVNGLKVLGQYTKVNQDKITGTVWNGQNFDTKWTYWDAQIAYDIPALKGLTLSLDYETYTKAQNTQADVDVNELRFRANYKF